MDDGRAARSDYGAIFNDFRSGTVVRKGLALIAFMMSTTLIVIAMQLPGEQTRSGQNLYVTQDAHDAVQDQRLKTLEQVTMGTVAKLDDVTDKQNYTLGGIALLGVLFTANAIIVRKQK